MARSQFNEVGRRRITGESGIKSKLFQPSLTAHFRLGLTLPDFVLGRGANYDQDYLQLACHETSLPGSQLATFEVMNDFTGVTERYAHRRMYGDELSVSFYVDANNYTPIKIFERWIGYISGTVDENGENDEGLDSRDFNHRLNYPGTSNDGYTKELTLTKFERNYNYSGNKNFLEYRFVGAFPYSINSMPVSYDGSQILKCSVQFRYIRYYITQDSFENQPTPEYQSPSQQARRNSVSFGGLIGGLVNMGVDRLTGND